MWKILLLLAGLFSGFCYGTKVDPHTWAQRARQADFVGVVECIDAGINIGKFRIVKQLKGDFDLDKPLKISNSIISHHGPPTENYVGEQYIIAAFKSPPKLNIMSISGYAYEPVMTRQLQFDLITAFDTTPYNLSQKPEISALKVHYPSTFNLSSFFDSDEPYLFYWFTIAYKLPFYWNTIAGEEPKELLNNLDKFLALSPENKDLFILTELFHKYLKKYYQYGHRHSERTLYEKSVIVSQFNNLDNISDKIDYVLTLDYGLNILEQGPYSLPLRRLIRDKIATLNPEHYNLQYYDFLVSEDETIQKSLPIVKINSSDVVAARTVFYQNINYDEFPQNSDWYQALDILINESPIDVSKFLMKFNSADKIKGNNSRTAFSLASYFFNQAGDNANHYSHELQYAKSLQVRLAAAIESTMNGDASQLYDMFHLKDLLAIHDRWRFRLSLNVARHGNKEALEDALRTLYNSRLNYPQYPPILDSILVTRLRVLLSNSAKISQIEQPPAVTGIFSGNSASESYEARLLKWWLKYKEQIQLTDVWLKELKSLGIE